MILRYPVQRQRTPPRASMTCCSVGAGVTRKRAAADTSMPGVEIPHCAPARTTKRVYDDSRPWHTDRVLQAVALAARAQSFERLHLSTGEASDRRHARAHRLPVEQDRARPTVAGVASPLCRRVAHVVARTFAQH